jgi:hypothetical protein
MECYRRAMVNEQTFEGRRENLSQANKLSRTYAVLLDALNRHRGKGQQKVTVEHVHVHSGGLAPHATVGLASILPARIKAAISARATGMRPRPPWPAACCRSGGFYAHEEPQAVRPSD